MNGIRNTYSYVCGPQRLLDIRRIYTSAGLIGLTLWQADEFNQADCHGQINLVKKKKFKRRSERPLDERIDICGM